MIIPNIWENKIDVPNHQPAINPVLTLTILVGLLLYPRLRRNSARENPLQVTSSHSFAGGPCALCLLDFWALRIFGESQCLEKLETLKNDEHGNFECEIMWNCHNDPPRDWYNTTVLRILGTRVVPWMNIGRQNLRRPIRHIMLWNTSYL